MADVEGGAPPAEAVKDAETKPTSQDAEQKDKAPESRDTAPAETERAKEQRGESRQNGSGGSRYRPRDKSGRKTDYDALPESSDPAEIRKQVEFYFSDANLARDKFLYQQLQGSKNVPVPVATIHSFKRMRRFQPVSAVVAALQESSTLTVVDADSDDPAIKRTEPFAAESNLDQEALKQKFEDAAIARTVYAKGFGDEKPTTQFDIEAFFAPYGTTNQVRLRRFTDGTFKGSVSVEFDSEETATNFIKADPKPNFQGKDLEVMSQRDFQRQKAEEHRRNKRDGRGGDDDWRTRRDEDRKRGFPGRDGRGGRGGRGGRDGRRDDRRDDRNRERREKEKEEDAKEDDKPEADAKAGDAKPDSEAPAEDKKRPRDETDADAGENEPKKRARSRSAEPNEGDTEVKEAPAAAEAEAE